MSNCVSINSTKFKLKKLVLFISMIGVFSGDISAQTVTVTGNVSPIKSDGSTSPWAIPNMSMIDSGTLTIDGGLVTVSGNVNMNNNAKATLINNGVLNIANGLIIAHTIGESAELSILSGSKVTVGQTFYIATLAGNMGTLNVSGSGALLQARTLNFSYAGNTNATVNILNGAQLLGNQIILGETATSNAQMRIDGDGSLVETTGQLTVGGNSAIDVSNGARLNTGVTNIGQTSDGLHTGNTSVVVQGVGSSWINTGELAIGNGNSSSILTINNGGLVRTGTLLLGNVAGGVYTLSLLATGTNRGVLETSQITQGTANTSILNFDGGILRATANAANFISGFEPVALGSQGLFMDTNGFNVGINTVFTNNTTGAPAGLITKLGAGTLTLNGANTYSGGTFVNQGLLLPTNNAALGTGAVTIGGAGQAAQLRVDTSIALPNAVNIMNQGTLYGVGQIGSTKVNRGGVISPGLVDTEIATLTVNGDVDFRDGGMYRAVFATDGSYNSDLLKVSGTAFLTGGILYHTTAGTSYEVGKLYKVLEAGTIDGTFSTLESDHDLLDLKAYYDVPGAVNVGLIRNALSIESLAITPNQKATARALDQVTSKELLDAYVLMLPKGTVPVGLDFVSGEVHATVRNSALSWSNMAAQQSVDQFRSNLSQAPSTCIDTTQSTQQSPQCNGQKVLPAWVQVIGNWRQISTDDNAAKSKQDTVGFVLGADYEIAETGWRVGGSFGYGKTNLHVDARNSTADMDNYSLSAYGGKRFPMGDAHINVIGGVAYTNHAIKTDRSIPRINQNLTSNYHGNTVQLFGEVGYAMAQMGMVAFEPFVGINVSQQKLGSFREEGSYAGVHADSGTETYTTSTLGLRAQSNFEVGGKAAQVKGMVGWKQVLGNNDVTRTMAFNVGSPNYTIAGVPLGRSTAVLSLQGAVNLSPTAILEASVGGEFGNKVSDQSVQARLRWAF
jgi:outer membrane autotransporter protein